MNRSKAKAAPLAPCNDQDCSSDNDCSNGLLQQELDRTIVSIRHALSELTKRERLHRSLLGMIPLLDRCEIGLIHEDGDSAFEYDEEKHKIDFRASTILHILDSAGVVIDEIGYDSDEEANHLRQLALNLFISHELFHIIQNFSRFSLVQDVKAGLPKFGLPIIDIAADVIACSISAFVDQEQREDWGDDGYCRSFVTCLVISYAVGTKIFESYSKPEKRQRAIGLLISAALVHAHTNNALLEGGISSTWQPNSPIILLDPDASGVFNAILVDEAPSLLFKESSSANKEVLYDLWNGVGTLSIFDSLKMISTLLIEMKAIRF